MKKNRLLLSMAALFFSGLAMAQVSTPGGTVTSVTNGTQNMGVGTDAPTSSIDVITDDAELSLNYNLRYPSVGTAGVYLKQQWTSSVYSFYRSNFPACGSGQVHIEPNSSGAKGIHWTSDGHINFSSNGWNIGCSYPVAAYATYNFDATVGAPTLVIGSTYINNNILSYSIPTGFDFAVQNKSHFGDFVGINTTCIPTDTDVKLAVNGKVFCTELKIHNPDASGCWPDYVFSKNFKLKSLAEVETYINENSHLPEVPAAEEVAKEGYNVTEMDQVLLKKIEELTLYVIELNKQNEELKKQFVQLQVK